MNLPNFTAIGEDFAKKDFVIDRDGLKSPEDLVKDSDGPKSPEDLVKDGNSPKSPEDLVKNSDSPMSPEDLAKDSDGPKSPEDFAIEDFVDLMKNSPEDAKKTLEAMPDGAIDEMIAKWSGADLIDKQVQDRASDLGMSLLRNL